MSPHSFQFPPIELVVNRACLVVFICYASSLNIINGPALRLTLSPVWMNFFWGFLAVGLLTSTLSALNLMQPYWTGTRATLRFVTDAIGGALWCWLMKANIIHELWIAKAHDPGGIDLSHMINTWMQWTFPYTVIVIMVILAVDLYRVLRVSRKIPAVSNPKSPRHSSTAQRLIGRSTWFIINLQSFFEYFLP